MNNFKILIKVEKKINSYILFYTNKNIPYNSFYVLKRNIFHLNKMIKR